MRNKISQQGLAPLLILVIVAVLAGTGFLGYKYLSPKNNITPTPKQQPQGPATPSKTIKKTTIAPRSKALGMVLAAVTAHGYNPKTGAAIKPDKYFTVKDSPLYLLMNINKPKVGTRLEYVRYLQGKYLDHRSIKVTQPNWKYAYFGWSNKAGKTHKKGIYRIRLYTNGVLEKKVNYIVR